MSVCIHMRRDGWSADESLKTGPPAATEVEHQTFESKHWKVRLKTRRTESQNSDGSKLNELSAFCPALVHPKRRWEHGLWVQKTALFSNNRDLANIANLLSPALSAQAYAHSLSSSAAALHIKIIIRVSMVLAVLMV